MSRALSSQVNVALARPRARSHPWPSRLSIGSERPAPLRSVTATPFPGAKPSVPYRARLPRSCLPLPPGWRACSPWPVPFSRQGPHATAQGPRPLLTGINCHQRDAASLIRRSTQPPRSPKAGSCTEPSRVGSGFSQLPLATASIQRRAEGPAGRGRHRPGRSLVVSAAWQWLRYPGFAECATVLR